MKPKLRFSSFTDDWKEIFLGNNGSFRSSGVDKKIYEGESMINLLNYMDVYNMRHIDSSNCHQLMQVSASERQIKECTVEKNDIFFTPTSETSEDIGHVMVMEETLPNTCYSYHLMRFRPYQGTFYDLFPNWGFQTRFIRRQMFLAAKGVQRMVMGLSDFENLRVRIPSLDEQTVISSYFGNLDELLGKSEKRLASLKQVKAASLQAMFPQKGEKVPKIRFNGFEGEWESVKLSSFAKRIMRKNSNLESTLALTIASTLGLVSQNDYFNSSVVGANISNYYLLKKGEFAYNKSYSNGYPFGSVKRLDRYEQGILSVLYIVFGIDNSISSDYLTHFFDTTLWHKDVAERAAEGARNHGLLNISAEDFFDISVLKPKKIEEQQQIAAYFTALDKQIALQTQRLEKLKQIKAACLDKMFV
ncbi:restriction endonuclease subunit S [Hoylesella shahii]|uniref:restriction endonuclease subunit S n=1 Tax=Hoylesella shahii TaxID=228603 RepID=UPI0028EF2824|nr:restriction endonuclease subunit S [Hoylesella shahii]